MDKLMMQNNLFGCSKSTQKVQCKQKIYFQKNNPFLEELFSVNSSYRRSIGTCQMFLKKRDFKLAILIFYIPIRDN